jgi:N-acetylglutamate synthase-like GNAT family acetyltransferase
VLDNSLSRENIAGAGRLLSDGTLYALICDIIVLPDCQNMGIGTEILTRLVKKCQKSNIRRVWLFAAPEKARFYEKHGFFYPSRRGAGNATGRV